VNVPPEDSGPDDDARRRPYDKVSKEVGEALRRARLNAGMSQEALGKKLRTRNGTPYSREKISTYERGQYIPEDRLRPQLAKVLKVPEEELFAALEAQGGDQPTPMGRLANRVERLERELNTLRESFNDHLDATAAELDAAEADRADRASKQRAGRSRGRRSSKDGRG
jgi:transcriptional regulator with XRE-family HTH domain